MRLASSRCWDCRFLLILINLPAFAQTGQGSVVGLVTDVTSALLPGASIVVRNTETGVSHNTATNEEGLYRVPYLNPGLYEITFQAQGFKRLVRPNIPVRSTETVRVNASLEVGDIVESVEVAAQAQLLETETATTGHLVPAKILNTLPTPQMKIQTILYYLPGVTSQAGFGHVAGQRSRSFVGTLDGVSGMEPVRGAVDTNRFLATVEHNMAEVKVLTTALPAEYGHSGGGVMNISYKSGTNQLHGLAEERYLGKSMFHRRWHEPAVSPGSFGLHLMSGTLSGPVMIPGLYNGRNRTFFLTGFQRHHEKASENNNRDVPSPAMLAGDFSFGGIGDPIYDPATLVLLPNGTYSRTQFPGNRVPASRFDPAVAKFLSFTPWTGENNRNNQAFLNRTGPRNNLSADTVFRSYRTGFDHKIDHSFSDRHRIFGRHSLYRHRSFNGRWQVQVANRDFDFNATPFPVDQQQLAISDSFTINPTTINEIRFGGNRRRAERIPVTLNQDWAGRLGIPNASPETMPTFLNSTGGQLFSRFPEGAETDVTESFSLQENMTLVRGRHTFKTGYEILRTRANSRVNAEPSGRYRFGGTEFPFRPNTGNPFASFLLGGVVRADFTRDLATWLPRWWSHAFYFQDDWKVTPTLTLNLGLRWQYESPFQTKYGQQSQFSPNAADPLTGRPGALLHPSGPLARRDWNNFQPRFGMAYNFRKDWVFRAGFAVNTLDLWTNGLRENFEEYFASAVVQPPPGNPDIAFSLSKGPPPIPFHILPDGTAPFVGTNFSGRHVSFYDPNMRSPYVMNWNAGFQRQIGGTMVVEFSYQGSSGVGLLNFWDINAIPLDIAGDFNRLDQIRRASQNFRPWPHFGRIQHYGNYGHNSFHSATVKLEKRYGHGLTFTSFYTRAKAIDEASSDGASTGITFYNRRLEKARSDYDVANRWVTYVAWELPFGRGRRWLSGGNRVFNALLADWNLNGIQTMESGAPFTFSFTGTNNVFLPGASRPDMAPGKTYDDIRVPWNRRGPCRHIVACAEPWAALNAFAYPASFTPGQSGRNIQSGPGLIWHQLSLSKTFPIRERLRFTLRTDVADVFKRPFFSRPNAAVDFRNPQQFGKIASAQGGFASLGGALYWHMIFKLEF